MSKDGSNNQNILIENTLNFNKLFAKKHNVSAIAGLSRQNFKYEGFSLGTNDLPNEDVRNISAGAGSSTRYISGSISEYRLFSVFGRLNYDYSGKYLFSATFRRDGTSRFGPNRKFGNFPAFSAGWRISEEKFLKDVDFISDLKLFASWGKMGSDQIADFQYLPMVSIGSNNYNLGATGAGNEALYVGSRLGGFANSDLQWQANVTSNIGINLGILDNKFILSAEYFVKKTDKLLQNVTIPTSSGYGSIYMNAGAVENKGVDLQLLYQQNFGDFHIDVAGNFSTLKNKVTSLGSSRSAIYGGQILPSQLLITKTDIGQPIGSFYGYKYVGVYQDTASIIATPHIVGTRPGDIQYADINGGGGALDSLGIPNGRITDKDKTFIGNPWPKFVYGLSVNASYKGFDMNLFLQGVYGNDIFNVQNGYFGDGYQGRYNAYARVLNSWTPQNKSTTQHRLGNESVNFVPSSRMVEKGSFLRLKNIQVGYTLPANLVNKVGIQRLRIFVSSQNLFTITKYSGYDPEIGARSNSNLNKGIDVGNYPQARSLMAGLQVDF
jgi:TonB-linked SusC/RagA family outer membrane protein